jgi:hypothetical protein
LIGSALADERQRAASAALETAEARWRLERDRPSRRRERRKLAPLPLRDDPRYVQACKNRAWTLALYRKDNRPLDEAGHWWRLARYRCGSWRCGGACGRQRATEDIARIRAGLSQVNPAHCVYAVLTWRPGKGDDYAAAYRGILQDWAKFRKRMTRKWGETRYITVTERHQSGRPHLNVVLVNPRLGAACAGEGWKKVRSGWMRRTVTACGFGPITWLEPMRSLDGLAVYISKLAGEIGKHSQVPIEAPAHFRRLRASRGMLPPLPASAGEYAGRLIQRALEDIDAAGVSPLPAFGGRPCLVDCTEAGAEDSAYEVLDAVEIEGGGIAYAKPYTREVQWTSWELSRPPPPVLDSAPPGACDDGAPPCSDSDAASAQQLGWWSGWPEGSGSDGIFHGGG